MSKKKISKVYQNDIKKDIEFIIGDLHFYPKNQHQKDFYKIIEDKEIIICSGPAGVGKSMLSIAKALELLKDKNNEYYKIIICTPAVEADEHLGSLPGSVDEKLSPYTYSSLYLIKKLIGEDALKEMIHKGYIEILALAYMRGINIDNAIVIAEEFQNATPRQVKTLLTRIGFNSKFIISGDLEQSDKFKKTEHTGLYDALKRLVDVPEIGIFKFDEKDIVRNKIISVILEKYKE
jgi:phosphate starvation-inducible PhoH-like protein